MELRKILFSTPEITAALRASGTDAARAFRSGSVDRIVVRDDPRQTVIVHLSAPSGGAPVRLVFDREEVAQALVQYCLRHGIPLPAAGRKVLWPQEEGLALMITLTVVTEDRQPNARPVPASTS